MVFDPTDMVFQCAIGFDLSRYDQQCLIVGEKLGVPVWYTPLIIADLIIDWNDSLL